MNSNDFTNPIWLERCRTIVRSVQFEGASVPAWRKLLGATSMTGFLVGSFALAQRLARQQPLEVRATCQHGVTMRCMLPDAIQWCIFLYGVWEPDITVFMLSSLQPGDVFVDVGAHIGYHSLLAAHCVGRDGAVVAIEASPSTYGQLQANLRLNGVKNVRAVAKAAAARTMRVPLFQGPAPTRGWATISSQRSDRRTVEAEIEAAPLTEILTPSELRRARLIKIDVEGAEDTVLDDLAKKLDVLSPDTEILVELTPRLWSVERTIDEVIAPFVKAGFLPYTLPNSYVPWRFLWPADVQPPQPVAKKIRVRKLDGQVDLLLSRRDMEIA